MGKPYDIIEHSGDLRLRVYGKTLEDVYVNASVGMFEAIAGKAITEQPSGESENVSIESGDSDALLIDFLNELLYQSDIHDAIFKVKITELTKYRVRAHITCVAHGPFALEIKAVTHHEMKIKKIKDGFATELLFDL